MPRGIKIGIIVVAIAAVLPIVAIIVLFVGISLFKPSETVQNVRREVRLANHGSLIIDGKERSRSEHGFSQRAGYRPPETSSTLNT